WELQRAFSVNFMCLQVESAHKIRREFLTCQAKHPILSRKGAGEGQTRAGMIIETISIHYSIMMPEKNNNSPADLIRPEASLSDLWKAAQDCRGCGIWERATQAVLGEGSPGAEVMMIGEQPGDREDIEGRPFVGPAGKL